MVGKRHIQNQIIVTNLRRNQEMWGGLHRWHPLSCLPGSPDQTTLVLTSGCLNALIWVYSSAGAAQHQHMGTRVWVWMKFMQFFKWNPLLPLYSFAFIFATLSLVLQHYFLHVWEILAFQQPCVLLWIGDHSAACLQWAQAGSSTICL